MARRLTEKRIVVASHNAGKVREINDLLRPFGLEAVSAADLNLPEPEETEDSFIGNALLKARAAATASGLPALSDDSGLAVDALDGAPGIHSARYAGPDRDFGFAMARLERDMTASGRPERTARFICALALVWPDGEEAAFEGKVEGEITFPPRGSQGFGYDPVFQPRGHSISFGEMDPDAKHGMSHRADAFRQLIAACLSD
ncbi:MULTISPECIES: RdgB/HAM1 family non-canonical purine NTP pyrophosphatase [unclassified Minwuia]|jgi:XTP/dITP diphosphohydrolase|uniref:RdgB/HAM1 family non-canonical purine NTP pyrophosphatase n=1 Tax=unclassified Minwuia TaxID=2618799 RepID=UPI002478C1C3|nr:MULTISPECIES: RdgB/HAM1 family non-canonical purine NTP pyrophosphatase [unclassified Minwuia]